MTSPPLSRKNQVRVEETLYQVNMHYLCCDVAAYANKYLGCWYCGKKDKAYPASKCPCVLCWRERPSSQ